MRICTLFILFFVLALRLNAQWVWHDPAEAGKSVIQGQGWPEELKGCYSRLPERAKEFVRPAVWGLSCNSAGVAVHFYSNAPRIRVRYQVAGNYAMPHMPSTGVSGVDLYARGMNGENLWCAGKYNFADTITYDFAGLTYRADHGRGYEYNLYLPLYNTVKWLEIGVPENTFFEFVPRRSEKPIVVYGTSITQGACASRPGMAWTALLERRFDYPLINLGFSGNGKLEKEVLHFVNEVDARLYILDCMPNMYAGDNSEELLFAAVKQVREKHPQTPILITEHDGYANERTNAGQRDAYLRANAGARKAYERLQQEGCAGLYYLSHDEIGMDMEAMVDGVHPTDWGMVRYAGAYEKKLREILDEPLGNGPLASPVRQRREAGGYEWNVRHEKILEMNRQNPPKALIIGNSIMHYWGGEPEAAIKSGGESWEKHMEPAGYRNLGFGWDRIENVLWRVYHDELDGFRAEKIVLVIGTNNLGVNTDEEIVAGLQQLVAAVRRCQPSAELKVAGVFPRRGMEKRIAALNREIEKIAKESGAVYSDAGAELLTKNGVIDESLFRDGLHPNEKGYWKIVKKIR